MAGGKGKFRRQKPKMSDFRKFLKNSIWEVDVKIILKMIV